MIISKEHIFFAHRGLHGKAVPEEIAPENSMKAFENAIKYGFGIELDVQKTSDDYLIVFHDESLLRMCNIDKKVRECSLKELESYNLKDSSEKIPLFSEVLKQVEGQVPLLIEIKPEGDWKKTTRLTYEMLKRYKGEYFIQSFHPLCIKKYKKYSPKTYVGQLAGDKCKVKNPAKVLLYFLRKYLVFNVFSKPDFISYYYKDKKNLGLRVSRRKKGRLIAAWTIRSQKELDKNRKYFDIFIFEKFIPD